ASAASAGRVGLWRAHGELKFIQNGFACFSSAARTLVWQTLFRQQFEPDRGDVGQGGSCFDRVGVPFRRIAVGENGVVRQFAEGRAFIRSEGGWFEDNPVDAFRLRLFPLGQFRFELRRRLLSRFFHFGNLSLESVHFFALLLRREWHRWPFVGLVVVLGLIEERVELVVFPLGDGVVFVRVALRAAH